MTAAQLSLPERRAVGAQLIGYRQFRHKPLLSEKFAHQPQRRPAVAATLDQHVEDLTFVVDGKPEIHPLASDPNNHRPGAIDPSGGGGGAVTAARSPVHFNKPAPDGFVGDVEPSLGEEILDVPA